MAVRGISDVCPGRLVASSFENGLFYRRTEMARIFAGGDRKEHGVVIEDRLALLRRYRFIIGSFRRYVRVQVTSFPVNAEGCGSK